MTGAAVRLVRPTVATFDAALDSDERLATELGVEVVPGWATFAAALEHTRNSMAAGTSDPVWGSRLFIAGDPPELVGWDGFKGAPKGGAAEIGYEIAEPRQGLGLATAAARAMTAEAFADPAVERVIAHTLCEWNASNRVLKKVGFVFAGEAVERDTPVWQFAIHRNDHNEGEENDQRP